MIQESEGDRAVLFYEVRNFQRVTGRARVAFDDELMHILATERVQHLQQWSARTDALDECVQKLDAASRELVQAIYTNGTLAIDVARQQGCAPKTIYNKLNFIRRALAECVQRRTSEAAK